MRVPYVLLASLSVMLLAIFLTAPTQGFEAGYGERDWIDLEQTELPPRPTRNPPTATPSDTPTPTDTPTTTPTETPTETPTPTATDEPTPTATDEPTPTATDEPTPTATELPTTEPTPTATELPTAEPTATAVPPTEPTATAVPPTPTSTATRVPPPPRTPLPVKSSSSSGGQTLDLQIKQSVSADLLQPAMLTTFTITTTHIDGRANAEQVLIFVELPTFLDIEQSTTTWGTLLRDDNRVQVSIPILYPRDQVILQVTARVNQEPMPELIQVIASVATASREITRDNNQAGVFLRRQ